MSPPDAASPTDRRPPFRYSATARVWFSDTDAQGVVYYGRYMPYFDHARTEYHRHLGLQGRREAGDFAMRAMKVEYVAPARFDDLIEVFVRISRIGTTSVTTEYAAYRAADDRLLCTAEQTAVFIDRERRKTPIPDAYRSRIGDFEGDAAATTA